MSKTVNIGVIGCGKRLSDLFKRLLPASDKVRIAGMYDPSPASIQAYREQFKTEAPAYRSYHELLQAPGIDWVAIGSWNCFHAEQAVAALRAGKHVFCEKPLATSLEDCLAVRDAWRRSERIFSMGFTLRYSPHYRRISEILSAGTLGRIVSMEFNETLEFNHGGYIMGDWRRLTKNAGTHLLEKCCHDIDLVNWMTGSRARRVASFGGLNFFKPESARHIQRLGKDANGSAAYQTWRGAHERNPFTAEKDIFDNQVAIIEFANGIRATFHTNCNSGIPERRMYICGTEGALRADVILGQIQVKRIGFDTKLEDCGTVARGGHGGGDAVLIESLLRSMLENKPPYTGLEDGLNAALTCFGLDEAANSRKVVEMEPIWTRADAAELLAAEIK